MNAKAGDLAAVTYSDSTPEVSYRYKRWGGLAEVDDVTRTRQRVYIENLDFALRTEKLSTNVGPLA